MGHDMQETENVASEPPTQPTQPKTDAEPVEIPVPSRDDVMRDLRKMAKPAAEPSATPRPYRRPRVDR